MQRIKGYLFTFLAILAGIATLWLGTMLFFTVLAFGAAAALAYRLGTGPQPITIRARAFDDRALRARDITPETRSPQPGRNARF